ncbi:ketoacyl-ACP synthase III [Amycolatopsis sp. NBC_00345]|uniref:beta-ketoacyl-ACP synthase III n=1 Tax=Amycolatopsis sp. NBC_00345 TaxID=2975955 RepID=UPI002E26E082
MGGNRVKYAAIAALGGYVPPRRVSNDEICRSIDSTDEWIRTRTGIANRHVVDPGVATSDLAVEAGRRALAAWGSDEVDLVVVSTATPDYISPPTAPLVAHRLGLPQVAAFDVSAACSGFVFGLATVAAYVRAGLARRVLFVSAETTSLFTDPRDRDTAPIFGDGAGAVVVVATDDPEAAGVLGDFDLGSDGGWGELVTIPGYGSRDRANGFLGSTSPYIAMRGRDLFGQAVTRLEKSARTVVGAAGLSLDEVDLVVVHQANGRIIDALADELELDPKKFFINIGEKGNTLSASIPLALCDAIKEGVLSPGLRVLITAFGGGTAWGSTVVTWPEKAVS